MSAQSPASAPICRAVQLEPFFNSDNCGMGRCEPLIDFRNASTAACTLPDSTSVTALNRHGAVIKHEHATGQDGPLVLQPGDFGEYTSVLYSSSKDLFPDPPPLADTYLFRFAPDDPRALRLPGAQGFEGGPRATFGGDYPPPDLSKVPQQTSGRFVLSAIRWPQPDPHPFFDLDFNPFLQLHVSVANRSTSASAGWNACRIVIETLDDQPQTEPNATARVPVRSMHACNWNGDLAHGTVAAGATVALELVAKLPQVCHLARYTISVRLENAPVKFSPLVWHTDALQPQCNESQVAASSLPPLVLPPGLKMLQPLHFHLPVNGIRLGLEIPARFADSRGIGTLFPGDPVVAEVWVENDRDTPLHLAGEHGFHLRVVDFGRPQQPHPASEKPRSAPPPELTPRAGSNDSGPVDLIVPPRTIMRVAHIDLGAKYDLPVDPASFQLSVFIYLGSLSGEDAKWNWHSDHTDPFGLSAVAAIHVQPPAPEK